MSLTTSQPFIYLLTDQKSTRRPTMDRFECSECGNVEFSPDDLEYRPCKCGGEYVMVPFEYGHQADVNDFIELLGV